MPKGNTKRNRRIRNLVIICALIAIILSVSTYAWFIGMRVVNVSPFDIEIATTDSLILSLDGETWDTTINISESTLDEVSYTEHTNSWGGRGLLPMSSIGEMDNTYSRMKLYEKASLTPTKGGYRLLASRVNNYGAGKPEQSGYVVFDLFIKNLTGPKYIEKLNEKDEEAIYLTVDSAVTVAEGGVSDTGIENSVRVAFAQIGRVIATTTDASKITSITCEPDTNGNPSVKNGVTGICRTAQIWEPNDTNHVDDAISWYEKSCKARIDEDVTDRDSYDGDCEEVDDGQAYPTYAVSEDIASSDNVDVYDGESYNTYSTTDELIAYDYFTDSEKLQTGTNRPTFMTLSPNSITKVRIYIYIEGQDIDNYDFASIGKKISIKFGFTKERFTEDDINYNGPDTNPGTDKVKPVITMKGNNNVEVQKGTEYKDAGATALDNVDGDITNKIQVINPVNTAVAGTYTVTYNVSDWAGNYATQMTRTVIVKDN